MSALLTPADVAARLQCSTKHVQRLMDSGRLRQTEPGQIEELEFLLFLERNTVVGIVDTRPVVYFLQSGANGPIKVGWTNNLPDRISRLQVGNPVTLTVLGVIRASAPWQIESAIHIQFAEAAVRGEWFAPSVALLTFIALESQKL